MKKQHKYNKQGICDACGLSEQAVKGFGWKNGCGEKDRELHKRRKKMVKEIIKAVTADKDDNNYRNRIIEECAKVAEYQKEICGLSMSRQSTCDDIAFNIRKLKNEH